MRRNVIIILLGFIVVAVAVLWLLRPDLLRPKTKVSEESLYLENLPDQSCPVSVQAVVTQNSTKKILGESDLTIANCNEIKLKKEWLSTDNTITLKVKSSLAIAVPLDVRGPFYARVQLGDVNNDNTINQSDENIIVASLGQTSDLTADLDADRQITILDLSLARVNHNSGAIRPGNKTWSSPK